jgi:hypothetical protein
VPRSIEYQRWATDLSSYADSLTSLVGPLVAAATPDVLVGGTLTVAVDVGLRASLSNAQTAASRLRLHADECLRRAAVCAAYTADMAAYEADVASLPGRLAAHDQAAADAKKKCLVVGPAPVARDMPVRVARWVERG